MLAGNDVDEGVDALLSLASGLASGPQADSYLDDPFRATSTGRAPARWGAASGAFLHCVLTHTRACLLVYVCFRPGVGAASGQLPR